MTAPPSRQNAEDFDPWSAEIWGPTRTIRPSGVPGNGPLVLLMLTRIKTPRGLFTNEKTNQQQADSRSNCIIEVWNFGAGKCLTADMWIIHRGIRYDVVGRNDMGADWRKQTVKYQCIMSSNPVVANET